MGIVRKYIEEGGGNFLTVKNCKIGNAVSIEAISLDDETFDKSYIIVDGLFDPTGEECRVRLGVQNLERIAEVLGDDETTWPGQKLTCIGTQRYPGLGTRGLLWSGVKAGRKEPVSDVDRVNDVINEILAAKTDLTRAAVEKLIEDEIAKAKGLINREAAVNLVASTLGVAGGGA